MLKMIREQQGLYGSKAVPTLSDEMFKRITDYARQNGFRTTVHVSSEWNAEAAALNGVTAMAHPVQRAVLNDSFVKLLVDRKIPISTTLINYTQIARYGDADGLAFLDEPLFKATMNAAERQEVNEERAGFVKINLPATFALGVPYAMTNSKRLFTAGVTLTSGTDRGYGPFVHMELAALNKAGIPAFDLIKVATLNGAVYIGREKDLGSVEAGKYADLLLLNADPAADVKNFQAIDTVIKNGQRIDLAALDLPVNHRTP
jgi:imidazolonepropionase-like amidohydrolase